MKCLIIPSPKIIIFCLRVLYHLYLCCLSALLRILLLLLPCFVLCMRLAVVNIVGGFCLSTNISLTFSFWCIPRCCGFFPYTCGQLPLLLEFCKLIASQCLLSNIFKGIIDKIKVFFSLTLNVKTEFQFINFWFVILMNSLCWNRIHTAPLNPLKCFPLNGLTLLHQIFLQCNFLFFLCKSHCVWKQLSSLSSH